MGSRLWAVALIFVVVMPITLRGSQEKTFKRPLDLPSGGIGSEEDEEDSPDVIHFYGSDYEGNGFFWCLDYSGSMEWDGQIAVLKQEMSTVISSLSRHADFNICAFGSSFVLWSGYPQQAMTGRTILIETHSDLVIRRVMRAIQEEQLHQEKVRINFVDISKSQYGYHYSSLNPLQINGRGQIANWPEGFMDDDLKEAKRLMNIMYDTPFDDDEEEDDE